MGTAVHALCKENFAELGIYRKSYVADRLASRAMDFLKHAARVGQRPTEVQVQPLCRVGAGDVGALAAHHGPAAAENRPAVVVGDAVTSGASAVPVGDAHVYGLGRLLAFDRKKKRQGVQRVGVAFDHSGARRERAHFVSWYFCCSSICYVL